MDRSVPIAVEYKRRVEAAHPGRVAKVVLFGSRARGDADADSDWDVAVFLRDDVGSRELDVLADVGTALLLQTGAVIQPVPLPISRENEDSLFLRRIRRDGVLV